MALPPQWREGDGAFRPAERPLLTVAKTGKHRIAGLQPSSPADLEVPL